MYVQDYALFFWFFYCNEPIVQRCGMNLAEKNCIRPSLLFHYRIFRHRAWNACSIGVSPEAFLSVAQDIMGTSHRHSRVVEAIRFRALFGVNHQVCAALWEKIGQKLLQGACLRHLLWSLLFLKVYATEPVNRQLTGADEKTFRKWSWKFVQLVSDLEIVSYGIEFRLLFSSIYS